MNWRAGIGIIAAFVAGTAFGRWAAAPVAQAYAPPQVVEAQGFVLKSLDGMKLAEMRVAQDGRPYLHFYDYKGQVIWTAPGVRPMPVEQR